MSQTRFADEHDLDEQRFYNLSCWTYGADPVVSGYVVNRSGLPAQRAARCQSEFVQLSEAWKSLLGPHLASSELFDKLMPSRNATGIWRFTEEMNDTAVTARCTASGTLSLSDYAGSLTGSMEQSGSCYLGGVPVDNTTSSPLDSGSTEDLEISFLIQGCTYTGKMNATGTSIEGNMVCTSPTADGGTTSLTGRWLAVR